MKRLAVVLILAGCVPTIETMKGAGSVQRTPDGGTGWRYAIAANAYDGVIEPSQVVAQHQYLIGQYLAEAGSCPRGYSTTGKTETQGIIVYEGRCK